MAKSNRKRASTKKVVAPIKISRESAVPLYQNETIVFNELVEYSNQFAKLKKQYDQYEFIKYNLIQRRNNIQKGKIKLPIQIQLTQDMYYSEGDKKKILVIFDEQIKTITNSITAVKEQVAARRDAYIESGLRLITFAERRFGAFKMQEFRPRGATLTKKEQDLTEKEYDELFKADSKDMKKPEVKAAFKEAMKLAEKKNKTIKK